MFFVLTYSNRAVLSNKDRFEEEKEKGFPTVGYVIFLCGSYKYEYCKCNCYLSCSVERIGSVCITLAIYIFLYFWTLDWFEALESLRRLLLASIIGVVSQSAAAAPTMGFLICCFFCWVFTRLYPYKDDSSSSLAMLLSYCLQYVFHPNSLLSVHALVFVVFIFCAVQIYGYQPGFSFWQLCWSRSTSLVDERS